jgi:hypothetical protein
LRSIPSNIKISRQNPTKCQRRLGHIRLTWDDPAQGYLDAYGWTDLKPTCEFLLDYEEEDDEDELASASSQLATRRR